MSNGVITLDEEGKIVTCNAAGLRILQADQADIVEKAADEFFSDANGWIMEMVPLLSG